MVIWLQYLNTTSCILINSKTYMYGAQYVQHNRGFLLFLPHPPQPMNIAVYMEGTPISIFVYYSRYTTKIRFLKTTVKLGWSLNIHNQVTPTVTYKTTNKSCSLGSLSQIFPLLCANLCLIFPSYQGCANRQSFGSLNTAFSSFKNFL